MASRSNPNSASSAPSSGAIVPAQLGFLAIFNPSLGNTDETIDDQIVYYASISTQSSSHKRRRTRGHPTQHISPEERNERLRQIGLAQGMASFSRGFSGGASVDAIDTEKSRVVLHELEPGWWILASIDLTKVPLPPRLATKKSEPIEERYEHSSREMKPANLLMRDLLRAHSIFLMHHDSSLSAFFVRTKRTKFVTILSRYWDLFLSTWSVMLHGNPARDVFGGINIAASGELGVGVGEEDRGSGEREVLEGLVGRIEGLVDLVVSKFGDHDPDADRELVASGKSQPWLGTGQEPSAEDGAIFLGTGALSRKSLRDVTHWMEDLFTWGEHAYGVIESPTSVRRTKKRRANRTETRDSDLHDARPPSIPPPVKAPKEQEQRATPDTPNMNKAQVPDTEENNLNKMVSYLKLGYGTYWSLPGTSGDAPKTQSPETPKQVEQDVSGSQRQSRPHPGRSFPQDATGHYLIGLKGNIEEEGGGASDGDASASSDGSDADHNSRTVLRTVHIELESEATDRPEATVVRDFGHPASPLTQSQMVGNMLPGYDSHDVNKAVKLRVVVYVNRPFIFVFLFQLRTDSLAWDSLYRSLHYQLAPLRKPLIASTRYRLERPGIDAVNSSSNSIYDLIWDPDALTIHTSIPNIPDNYAIPEIWSRTDALNTHLHLLNIHAASRSRSSALERTQKTNRGWWIVWTRVLDRHEETANAQGAQNSNLTTIQEAGSDAGSDDGTYVSRSSGRESSSSNRQPRKPPAISKEIFLTRRASDHIGFRAAYTDSSTGGGDGAGRLAQGIGIDTRRYVEELLSLL